MIDSRSFIYSSTFMQLSLDARERVKGSSEGEKEGDVEEKER